MVKTFASIWLNIPNPPPDSLSLLSSATTLTLHDLYSEDDIHTIESVQKVINQGSKSKAVDFESGAALYRTPPSSLLRDSRLFKSACLHLIKDCISQLSIVIAVDAPAVGDVLRDPFHYKSISERFGDIQQNYNTVVLGEVYTDMHRVQKEVKNVIKLMEELYDEVKVFCQASCINAFVNVHYRMIEDEAQLMADCRRMKHIYHALLDEIVYDRDNTALIFEEMDRTVNLMNVELKDLIEVTNKSTGYTKNWQLARREQNTIVLQADEEAYKSAIKGLEAKVTLEGVCHVNIQKYYEETRNDYFNDIERWMDLYDTEIETRETQILNIKHKTNKVIEERQRLQEVYDRRSKRIEDWLEHKRLQKEEEDRIALEIWAATKIQAWWRGVMFRKHLGPYKKKKGKKVKKNKKKISKK